MKIEYLSSYDRSFRKAEPEAQQRGIRAIDQLLDYYLTGRRPLGLGLRRLRGEYWEIRAGLDQRVVFDLRKDRLTFVFFGNHNDVRRFLR